MLATSGVTAVHNIQNYSNFHIEMPQQIVMSANDDRVNNIHDENGKQESLLLNQRPNFNSQSGSSTTKNKNSTSNVEGASNKARLHSPGKNDYNTQ